MHPPTSIASPPLTTHRQLSALHNGRRQVGSVTVKGVAAAQVVELGQNLAPINRRASNRLLLP
jgi:hypothetical protein